MPALSTLFPKALVASMIVTLVLVAIPIGAAASEPTVVRLASCAYGNDGQASVSPGDVVLSAGWGAGTKGLTVAFVKGIDLVASIDGQEIPDVDSYWGKPFPQPEGIWRMAWTYDAGTLAAGETMNVSFVMTLRHPLPDLTVFEGNTPFVFPAGSAWDLGCQISAS
jgi:hypothetical protein